MKSSREARQRYYPPYVKLVKKNPYPGIPRVAAFGWSHYPISTKVQIVAVFLGLCSLTTPFWAWVNMDVYGEATFGLWQFCFDTTCTSIHDNLVPGKSVPAWYHLAGGSFCIGIVASLTGLFMLTTNTEGKIMKMTPTVHRTAVCVLGISVLQQFVGIFTFISYFEELDFLYQANQGYLVDFHASFYVAIVSAFLSMVTAVILVVDEDITKARRPLKSTYSGSSREKLLQGYPSFGYTYAPTDTFKFHKT